MRYVVCVAAVMVVVLAMAAPRVAAQEHDQKMPTIEDMERFERALELEARKAELALKQEMGKLELEQRRVEIERRRRGPRGRKGHGGGLLLLIVITNILLTVWVFRDMHEQKIGRALWVPIVLLAGIFGALLYAIVRLADTRPKPPEAEA